MTIQIIHKYILLFLISCNNLWVLLFFITNCKWIAFFDRLVHWVVILLLVSIKQEMRQIWNKLLEYFHRYKLSSYKIGGCKRNLVFYHLWL